MKNIPIAQVMTPNPICMGTRGSVGRAIRILRLHNIRQVPVTSEGRLRGVVTEHDLNLARGLRLCGEVDLGELMHEDPHTVAPDTSLATVLREMFEYKSDFCLIVRGHDEVLGIFTRQDALELLLENPRYILGAQATEAKPIALAA